MLEIDNLTVDVEQKEVVKNLSLVLKPGSLYALMGQNGSGKSSLAYTLMGHPRYTITGGSIRYNGILLNEVPTHQRAQMGLFLAFQYPYEIPGLTLYTFLKEAFQACSKKTVSSAEFTQLLNEGLSLVGLDQAVIHRALNDGFSGGEKKRLELLQALVLNPSYLIFDEIDSGLDIDGLMMLVKVVQHVRHKNPDVAMLFITHYQKVCAHINPDVIFIMHNGSIIKTGNNALADAIEAQGYSAISHEL